MLVWLNGAFGVGKTTTANGLVARRPDLRTFDPEWVGYMLRANLAGFEVNDFQDLAAWRELVPLAARAIRTITAQPLVAVQTVLSEQYWNELRAGVRACGMRLVHVVLHADEAVLRSRIRADELERDAEQWRLEHIPAYLAAVPWLTKTADAVVDTSHLSTDGVVAEILSSPLVATALGA